MADGYCRLTGGANCFGISLKLGMGENLNRRSKSSYMLEVALVTGGCGGCGGARGFCPFGTGGTGLCDTGIGGGGRVGGGGGGFGGGGV